MFARILYLTAALLLAATSVLAQPVTVIGPVTPGHAPVFNSTTVLKDSGGVPVVGPSGATTVGGLVYWSNTSGLLGDAAATTPNTPPLIVNSPTLPNNSAVLTLNASGVTLQPFISPIDIPVLTLSGAQDAGTQGETVVRFEVYGAGGNSTLATWKSGGAQFQASVAPFDGTSSTLTVSSMTVTDFRGITRLMPNSILPGQIIFNSADFSIPTGATITSQVDGTTGGTGHYRVNVPGLTNPLQQMYTNDPSGPQGTHEGDLIAFWTAGGWFCDANPCSPKATRTDGLKAGITLEADPAGGHWTSTNQPARVRFFTTPPGSTVSVEHVFIESTGELDQIMNGLGVALTNGISLRNNTSAVLGAQQNSPTLHWRGGGFDTGASASRFADVQATLIPVQGNPIRADLVLNQVVGGVGPTFMAAFRGNGIIDAATGFSINQAATAGHILKGNAGGTAYTDSTFAGACTAASSGALGCVQGDNATLSISGPGVISLNLAQANTWTGTITETINQNASTSIAVNNNSTGTAAGAQAVFNNSANTGSVGIKSTGFTALPILQNRVFLDASASTAGIVLNNEGAQPILFAVSSVEVGRWDSATPGQLDVGVAGTTRGKLLLGGTSGSQTWQTTATTSGTITFPSGTTDFSAAFPTFTATLTGVGGTLTQGGTSAQLVFGKMVIASMAPTVASVTGATGFTITIGTAPKRDLSLVGKEAVNQGLAIQAQVAAGATVSSTVRKVSDNTIWAPVVNDEYLFALAYEAN